MNDRTERFELRLDKQMIESIDAWRSRQPDTPTRSEAMRRLAAIGMNNETGKQLYELTRFQVLTMSLTPGPGDRLSDGYVFAWDRGVYPWNDEGTDLHVPFEPYFRVSKEMGHELSQYLDEKWLSKEVPTFYELETYYGVRLGRTLWTRGALLVSCRYMFLNELFDKPFWKKLLTPTQHPTEASVITRKFDREELCLL